MMEFLRNVLVPQNIIMIILLLSGGYFYSEAMRHKVFTELFWKNIRLGTFLLLGSWMMTILF